MGNNVLTEARIKKEISINKAAEQFGVTITEMQDLERKSGEFPARVCVNGKHVAGINVLYELAKLYERLDTGFFIDVLGEKYFKRLIVSAGLEVKGDYFQINREKSFHDFLYEILSGAGYDSPLKLYRIIAGLSQLEAAEGIGVATNTIMGYEDGEKTPLLRNIIKASEFYGTPVKEFLDYYAYRNNEERDLSLKINRLIGAHPETTEQELIAYVGMDTEQFEKCKNNQERFPVYAIKKMSEFYNVDLDYFRGHESRLEFDLRMKLYNVLMRENLNKTSPDIMLFAVAKLHMQQYTGDNIGIIVNEDYTEIFPFIEVFVNVKRESIVFIDDNNNAIVLNQHNTVFADTQTVNTGGNTSSFIIKTRVCIFPAEEGQEFSRKNAIDFVSTAVYGETNKINNSQNPCPTIEANCFNIVHVTFFEKRRFTDNYLSVLMSRGNYK